MSIPYTIYEGSSFCVRSSDVDPKGAVELYTKYVVTEIPLKEIAEMGKAIVAYMESKPN